MNVYIRNNLGRMLSHSCKKSSLWNAKPESEAALQGEESRSELTYYTSVWV